MARTAGVRARSHLQHGRDAEAQPLLRRDKVRRAVRDVPQQADAGLLHLQRPADARRTQLVTFVLCPGTREVPADQRSDAHMVTMGTARASADKCTESRAG